MAIFRNKSIGTTPKSQNGKAIETLVNFSAFAENNRLGGLVMSVSWIEEKELVAALKLTELGHFLRHHSINSQGVYILAKEYTSLYR